MVTESSSSARWSGCCESAFFCIATSNDLEVLTLHACRIPATSYPTFAPCATTSTSVSTARSLPNFVARRSATSTLPTLPTLSSSFRREQAASGSTWRQQTQSSSLTATGMFHTRSKLSAVTDLAFSAGTRKTTCKPWLALIASAKSRMSTSTVSSQRTRSKRTFLSVRGKR